MDEVEDLKPEEDGVSALAMREKFGNTLSDKIIFLFALFLINFVIMIYGW